MPSVSSAVSQVIKRGPSVQLVVRPVAVKSGRSDDRRTSRHEQVQRDSDAPAACHERTLSSFRENTNGARINTALNCLERHKSGV
jgi:hypothetical protein